MIRALVLFTAAYLIGLYLVTPAATWLAEHFLVRWGLVVVAW